MNKILQVAILLSLILIITLPFSSRLLGRLTENKFPNWSKIFFTLSERTSFGLHSNEKVTGIKTPKIIDEIEIPFIHIDNAKVTITNKRVISVNHEGGERTHTFIALIKNNSGYGIPEVSVKSLKIYDKNKKLIGEKTDFTDSHLRILESFFLVKDGELPYSYELITSNSKFKPYSFDLELNIPDFYENTNISRLDVQNVKLIKIQKFTSEYHYQYLFKIKNNTQNRIDNINFIGFLKYKDNPLMKIEDSCCTQVLFKEAKSPISLDEPEISTYINPGEEKTFNTEYRLFGNLYPKSTNFNKLEHLYYFVGQKTN